MILIILIFYYFCFNEFAPLDKVLLIFFFNHTALHQAVYKGNPEIVKLLMTNDNLNINMHNISSLFFIYSIKNNIFQLYSQYY